MNATTKGKQQSAKSTNKKDGFSAEEKAAMKARAKELKSEADGEAPCAPRSPHRMVGRRHRRR